MSGDPYIETTACVERLWKECETHGRLIVAFDFDDTVFDFHKRNHSHERVLRLLRHCKNAGFYLVMFTASAPERFNEMLTFLEAHGIEVDSVNKNPIAIPFGHHGKIYYNILLDDRAGLGQAVAILEEVVARCDAGKGDVMFVQRVHLLDLENRIREGEYLSLQVILGLIPNNEPFEQILKDHRDLISRAAGSSHNHQAWEGGYLDHITECLNIAAQIFWVLDDLRPLPFLLSDVLVVMVLHDLEKPWKQSLQLKSKEQRREFRDRTIADYGIKLSDSQRNALRYVEGVPDSEYTPGERTMGELAAFCHMVDIASARIWHDKGREGKW